MRKEITTEGNVKPYGDRPSKSRIRTFDLHNKTTVIKEYSNSITYKVLNWAHNAKKISNDGYFEGKELIKSDLKNGTNSI